MSVLYFWLARHGPPEEEPTCWYQVFGVVNGKLVLYGAPLEIREGVLDENVSGNAYKFFGKRTLPFPYHQAELMGSLGRKHVGVTCDRTPRFPVLLPEYL